VNNARNENWNDTEKISMTPTQDMTLHLNDFCSNVINNARTPFLETKKPLHLNGISTTHSAKIQEWKPKGKAKDESLNETENCLSIYSLLYN